MVVGGEGNDKNVFDVVELKSSLGPLPDRLKSRRLSKFPLKIKGAEGVTLGDASLPHVCGGKDNDGNYRKECYVFHPGSNRWSISGQLGEVRAWGGSATHPDHGWVIACGWGEGGVLSSAELTTDGKTFRPSASCPLPLHGHCIVSLGKGGGGRGEFFLTGGRTTGNVYSKKAFIYEAGNWREVADLPTARRGKK